MCLASTYDSDSPYDSLERVRSGRRSGIYCARLNGTLSQTGVVPPQSVSLYQHYIALGTLCRHGVAGLLFPPMSINYHCLDPREWQRCVCRYACWIGALSHQPVMSTLRAGCGANGAHYQHVALGPLCMTHGAESCASLLVVALQPLRGAEHQCGYQLSNREASVVPTLKAQIGRSMKGILVFSSRYPLCRSTYIFLSKVPEKRGGDSCPLETVILESKDLLLPRRAKSAGDFVFLLCLRWLPRYLTRAMYCQF